MRELFLITVSYTHLDVYKRQMVKSMVVVTLGNMVGGALLLAWPLRKMSADK